MGEFNFEKENKTELENQKVLNALLDHIQKEYFEYILDCIDQAEEVGVDIGEVEKLLDIDVKKMKKYIDLKMPELLEEIKELSSASDVEFVEHNSLRDVLSNSVLVALKKIAWVTENFNANDEKIKGRIFNPESATRRVIGNYVEKENKYGVATYYIDELCRDKEKLKMELSSENGYLEKFQEFFQRIKSGEREYVNYPTGGKKMPYFKFFSEVEKGNIATEELEEILDLLDENVVDKKKIRERFF